MNPLCTSRASTVVGLFLCAWLLTSGQVHSQSWNFRYAKQGYSMRLCFDNRGTFGVASYTGNPFPSFLPDSIGLEYPIGQRYEHVYGAGLWIGGKLDTSRIGTSTPIRLATTAYEGWAGPFYEFFPGNSMADSIWSVTGRGVQRPPSWEAYWGNSIPRNSVSDNDRYCTYTDTSVRVAEHVPLRLKVVQSSFAWNGPYAEAIHVLEYKIMNMGHKPIDSMYIGLFNDGSVGPYNVQYYFQRNYAGHFLASHTAYIHNPIDFGSTPIGNSLLYVSRPLDSLRYSFRWWSGPQHPMRDSLRYRRLSSGLVDSNQSLSNLADINSLISIGPFTLRPRGSPIHDTIVVAFGVVSGQNLSVMRQNAERARQIYLSGGQVGVNERRDELPERMELFQNYPNPFNPMTTIRFMLDQSARVKLSVYDVLGEEVATLVSVQLSAGAHAVLWDASSRPSGVYFCRLEAGSFVETKKLVLVR